jgi:hypothetical protein
MAGPVPAIHVFTYRAKDVDGRHKGGHDDEKEPAAVRKFHGTAVARGRP